MGMMENLEKLELSASKVNANINHDFMFVPENVLEPEIKFRNLTELRIEIGVLKALVHCHKITRLEVTFEDNVDFKSLFILLKNCRKTLKMLHLRFLKLALTEEKIASLTEFNDSNLNLTPLSLIFSLHYQVKGNSSEVLCDFMRSQKNLEHLQLQVHSDFRFESQFKTVLAGLENLQSLVLYTSCGQDLQ